MQDLYEKKVLSAQMKNILRRIFNKIKFFLFAGRQFEAQRLSIESQKQAIEVLNQQVNEIINYQMIIAQSKFDRIFNILHCRPSHLSNPYLMSEENIQTIGFHHNNVQNAFDYVDFENEFRGSEALIKERQRCYLPFFEGSEQPILDVGSGRGEFLELANENNLLAIGIELNQGMVEYCQKKGLKNVIRSDCNSFLRQLPKKEKMSGIFSAQVIEHLEFDYLFEFLQLSYNALNDHGVFIAETINPHCTPALKLFYLDLSHVKPIFPETLLFLMKNVGFSRAKIFFPYQNSFSSEHIFAEGDYAVIAWK